MVLETSAPLRRRAAHDGDRLRVPIVAVQKDLRPNGWLRGQTDGRQACRRRQVRWCRIPQGVLLRRAREEAAQQPQPPQRQARRQARRQALPRPTLPMSWRGVEARPPRPVRSKRAAQQRSEDADRAPGRLQTGCRRAPSSFPCRRHPLLRRCHVAPFACGDCQQQAAAAGGSRRRQQAAAAVEVTASKRGARADGRSAQVLPLRSLTDLMSMAGMGAAAGRGEAARGSGCRHVTGRIGECKRKQQQQQVAAAERLTLSRDGAPAGGRADSAAQAAATGCGAARRPATLHAAASEAAAASSRDKPESVSIGRCQQQQGAVAAGGSEQQRQQLMAVAAATAMAAVSTSSRDDRCTWRGE